MTGHTIRRSPSWGFPGVPSALRQITGDLCTAPGIISLSPLFEKLTSLPGYLGHNNGPFPQFLYYIFIIIIIIIIIIIAIVRFP